MDRIVTLLSDLRIPFAYHHFAEGEAPDPPFICYLVSGSDNFFSRTTKCISALTRYMLSCTQTSRNQQQSRRLRPRLMVLASATKRRNMD